MADAWREKSELAFKFIRTIFIEIDQSLGLNEPFSPLITHLKWFEEKSLETFKYIIEAKADPVYVLHILIDLCNENRAKPRGNLPRFTGLEVSGSLEDPGDFCRITESELAHIEAALPKLEADRIPVNIPFLKNLRQRVDSLPPPPQREGYVGERMTLTAEIGIPPSEPDPIHGRPGDHYYNMAMVLLVRHFQERSSRHKQPVYTSVVHLLNKFCPKTFGDYPLNKELVRQRIEYLEKKAEVKKYCRRYEKEFEEYKKRLKVDPRPFYPWKS